MRAWRRFRELPLVIQLAAVALGLFLVLSLDWRPENVQPVPRVVGAGHASGPLEAGAAEFTIDPPFPTPIGGFAPRGSTPFESILGSLGTRALVVQVGGRRIGFVSVEVVVVPADLRREVVGALADLHLDELFIGATHTHSGLGGYWDNRVAEVIGLGRYDPRVERYLVGQIAGAVRAAAAGLRPARIAVGQIEASNYAYNRSDPGGPVDKQLTGVRVVGVDGKPIANVIVYAVHPTIISMNDHRLSGDWPGAMMAALEAEGGPPTLFFQGAVGDVTWGKRMGEMPREERVVRFGQAIASDARGALAAGGEGEATVPLDWARVRIGLPPCDVSGAVWKPFERIVSNVFCWAAHPTTTDVSYVRLGDLRLADVPGEVVTSLGLAWRTALDGAVVVSLMDDYVGYVEAPANVEAKHGEAQHVYFGPSLAPALFDALVVARDAAR